MGGKSIGEGRSDHAVYVEQDIHGTFHFRNPEHVDRFDTLPSPKSGVGSMSLEAICMTSSAESIISPISADAT